jgi:hypothetical protein
MTNRFIPFIKPREVTSLVEFADSGDLINKES